MIALAGSVLVASLLGSPHCAGMCGAFVCFYAGQEGERRTLAHLAYNAGRLVSYAVLGIVAGILGAGVDRMGAAAGVSRGAALLAGACMVLWGGATIVRSLGARLPAAPAAAFLGTPAAAAIRAVHRQPPAVRALTVGLLSTLLPCGWLYLFVATAGGTGSAAAGAAVMAAFWVGTLPVMAGLGAIAQGTLGPLRRRLPVVTAAVLVVVGLLTVAGRLQTSPQAAGKPASCAHHGR